MGETNFFSFLYLFDGGHFLGIAQNGYLERSQYAFFPLYPVLVSFFSGLTHLSYPATAFFLSTLFSIGSFIFLYKLIRLDFSEKIARRTLILLLIFPASFYLLLAYSESLFLFTTLAAFYFTRKKNYFLAAIFGGLSAVTRLVGVITILALWIEAFRERDKGKYLLVLAPLGFLLFCLYLRSQAGDPFYFFIAEREWNRILALPGISILDTLLNLFTPGYFLEHLNTLGDLIFTVFGLGLAIKAVKSLRLSYGFYALGSVLVPVLSTSLTSMPRFLLMVWPIFLVLSLLGEKYQKYRWVWVTYRTFSVLLLTIYLVSFLQGYDVS